MPGKSRHSSQTAVRAVLVIPGGRLDPILDWVAVGVEVGAGVAVGVDIAVGVTVTGLPWCSRNNCCRRCGRCPGSASRTSV